MWSGWVGIGQMTGFGQVRPLPGIWDSLHLNSAITLPIGVEAYAAYALRAWLSPSPGVSRRARRFAKWSAIGSLVLGMAGQAGYHLLTQAGVARAPWAVTTVVSCLPVLVLGMGAALAHLLHAGTPEKAGHAVAGAGGEPDQSAFQGPHHVVSGDPGFFADDSAGPAVPGRSSPRPAADQPVGPVRPGTGIVRGSGDCGGPVRTGPRLRDSPRGRPAVHAQLAEARSAAARLTAEGARVSRRALRAAGVRGSNADLGELSRVLLAELAAERGQLSTLGVPGPRRQGRGSFERSPTTPVPDTRAVGA